MSQHIPNRLAAQLEIVQLKQTLKAAERIINELKAENAALMESRAAIVNEAVPAAAEGGS